MGEIGIGCRCTLNIKRPERLSFYVMVYYPLIMLTIGLFGFDKLGFDTFPKLQFYYWGSIPEALKQLGCRVLVTKVPRYQYQGVILIVVLARSQNEPRQ